MRAQPEKILNEIKKVIHGKDDVIYMVLCAVLAGGHVLLEDIPGVGKTTLAVAMSKAMSLDYRRVQFTPDVLPGDLTGFRILDNKTGDFRFEKGSIYTNFFLADEINRTSPKTQSALLEVMEERQVSVEGQTFPVPEPFFVLATQNPFGSSGTQRLPDSQLDRFLVCLTMGYPDHENAVAVLKGDSTADLKTVAPVADAAALLSMQEEVRNLYVDDCLYEYVVALTEGTRDPALFSMGLSPRGSIALLKMAKAAAFVNGRDFVTPENVKDVFYPVAGHRVRLSALSRASETQLRDALNGVLERTKVPKL